MIIISWIVVIIIAGLPLFPIPYFNGKFYARSGTCLALHITPHKPEGWEYSVAIFLASNLVAFLIILGCYCYMYKTIRLSRRKMNKLKARMIRETQVNTGLLKCKNCELKKLNNFKRLADKWLSL